MTPQSPERKTPARDRFSLCAAGLPEADGRMRARGKPHSTKQAAPAAAPSPELLETLQFLLSRAHQLADQGGDCYEELAEIYFTFHHAICVASQNTLAPSS